MPEDDPTTFARVLEFIHFGTIPDRPNEEALDRILYSPNNDPDVETNSFVHTARSPRLLEQTTASSSCSSST